MNRFTYAALLSLSGCFIGSDGPVGGACTEMGCEDGLSIQFSVSQPGSYSFDIVADGRPVTCTATLPLPACGNAAATCSDSRVFIGESGCALPQSDHSLEGLTFMGMHPESVTITVERDGAELTSQTFTPSYQRLAPNGEECGPVCHQATETLSIPNTP